MKKRILSLLLAAVMVLLLIPVIAVPVSATPAPASIAYATGQFWKTTLSAGSVTRLNDSFGFRGTRSWSQLTDGVYGTGIRTYGTNTYVHSIYLADDGQLTKVTSTETTRGEYFGYITIALDGLSTLNSFSILASDVGGDFTGQYTLDAFDILYSVDGTHWTLAKSFTGMCHNTVEAMVAAGWEDTGDTNSGYPIYAAKTTFDSVQARYIAIGVVTGIIADGNGDIYIEEISVVGTRISDSPASVSITEGSFTGYKGFLTANDGQDRYKQRGYSINLDGAHPIEHAFDGNLTGTYAGGTGAVTGYYPELYLNASGELVRDTTYDNVNVTVNFSDYAASGLGKYYGVFKFTLEELTCLETLTIWAGPDNSVDCNKAFDILYSADGTHWTVGASYVDMATVNLWTSVVDSVYTLKIPMGGAIAKYIMYAPSIRAGQLKQSLWLFEIAAEGTEIGANGPVTYEAGTTGELIGAVKAHNISQDTGDVIKLTADIVLPSSWESNVGDRFIYGTFNGQGHTVYNLQTSFVWPFGNCLIENFTVSGKTASDGNDFYLTGKDNSIFGSNAVASEIGAGETAIIHNVTNNRETLGTSNVNAAFFGALTIAGTVRFESCTNNGRIMQRCDDPSSGGNNNNHKIGGYVGSMASGTVVFVNCTNNGDVNASQAGGFVGVYAAGTTMTFTGCSNNGDITGIANGTAYGVAGGFIGGFNNAGSVGSDTTISIIGGINTGDIKVKYTADSSKDCATGGFIGHAGGSTGDVVYTITIDNCAVLNCTIDAVGDDATYGNTDSESNKEYAGSFLGKVSPQGTAHSIVAKNSYISNVSVRADHARAFIGVGSYSTPAQAINLVVVNLDKRDVETGAVVDWDNSRNVGCTRAYSATDFFTQTDGDLITGGNTSFAQDNGDALAGALPSKVRFAATLDDADIDDLALVGYQVVASYNGGASVHGWTKTSTQVYTSLNENLPGSSSPSTKTANQLHAGDDYIFAITVEEIPSYIGDVTFVVTPFVVKNNGTILFGKKGSIVISCGEADSTPVSLMSYNVKDGAFGKDDQSPNQRKTGLAKTIALEDPEIVCLQECNALSASTLASACASNGTRTYTVYQPDGKTTALMYDASLYTKLAQGYADITVPVGDGGDGYTRSGVWLKLQRKSDNVIFYVVSAHFDLNKPGTSADMLLDYIEANFKGIPTIIAGDLNANEARWVNTAQMRNAGYANANTEYTTFLSDHDIRGYDPYSWNDRVNGSAADNGLAATFPSDGWIIDWCYYSDSLSSSNYHTVTTAVSWSYSYESMSFPSSGSCTANPSDHYPIYTEITFGI